MLKRTSLFTTHNQLGGKLVEFGGWEMPVQYTSITDEHLAVRNAAGIFDISHMGEVTVSGAAAADFLNHVLTNDIRKISAGEGQYTLMCNERGGTIDDLYVYCLSHGVYFMVVNASRVKDDVAWLQKQLAEFPRRAEMFMTDASHNYAAVAIQGPRVKDFIDDCIPSNSNCAMRVHRVTDLKKNQIGGFLFNSHDVLISRTGYTGEDGFEIVGNDKCVHEVWDKVLEVGKPYGIKPCGLGARDTLRLEMCYPLNGSDLSPAHNPLEAGLGFFVDLTKPKFTGRENLLREKEAGLSRRLVPFKMKGKSPPPRPHYRVFRDGHDAGELTSGTLSPSLNYGIGMAYLTTPVPKPGEEIEIEIRGQKFPAVIEKKPLYKKS
jgi:aminomethyltransferase